MLYTPLTKKALQICFEAHKDKVDKSGLPYIHHPLHLAEQMTDELTTVVALLHDVVEDSDITLQQLAAEGFPTEVLDAIALMTHGDHVDYKDYMDYVKKIKENPIATAVKLADLTHNSDITRLDVVTDKDLRRVEKYQKAKALLTE